MKNLSLLTNSNKRLEKQQIRNDSTMVIWLRLINLQLLMWRSIGSVASSDKHNKSREQSNYQAFAQASKLKLNQSQLSGQASSSQFLNQYFVKKRSQEGMLQRVLSQKNIESRPLVSPPSSLKQVPSPRIRLKSASNEIANKEGGSTLNNDRNSIEDKLQKGKTNDKKEKEIGCQVLRQELKTVKNNQAILLKNMTGQFNIFRRLMKQTEQQMNNKIEKMETDRQRQKECSFNPQLMKKLRVESSKFNERMKQIDDRKQLIKEKYRTRLQRL